MKLILPLLCTVLMLFMSEVQAADVDARFLVELTQEEESGRLNLKSATELALPILWQRIVPAVNMEKANTLSGGTALVLQFKSMSHGVRVVFNPNQVSKYLARRNITMIPEQPHWNLTVDAQGFSDSDEDLSQDLLNYSRGIADEYGFHLSKRGRKLQLLFTPSLDVYGEVMFNVVLQGAFSSELLSETVKPAEGYASYQLQDFLEQVLTEIRDAYSLGSLTFEETTTEILLTIESDYSLATQVMLEQALNRHPSVLSVMPTLLQKSRKQYRVQLRDGDETWIEAWFSGYGLTAKKQPEGSFSNWFAQ